YLMSVAALELRQYCTYEDPLVRRPDYKPVSQEHPVTVSLEAEGVALQTAAETATLPELPESDLVRDALADLSERRQAVFTAAYGLFDNPMLHSAEIAAMLNVPKKVVENELYRGKRALADKLGPYAAELGLRAG